MPHRSYLVNVPHVKKITKKLVFRVALLALGCLTWLFSPFGYWNITTVAVVYSTLLFILLSVQRGYSPGPRPPSAFDSGNCPSRL